MYCFGSAGDGKLGVADASDSLDLLQVALPSPIAHVAAGCDHTVVVDQNGRGMIAFLLQVSFFECLR